MSEAAHIVVVDDDVDVRETVAEYLRRNGFAVTEADGGAALREVMASRPIDLALLDINMPGDDGLTLAREIRGSGQAGIIMLTANNDDLDKIVGLEVGADDYVTKPFNPRELLARVKAVLRRARSSGDGHRDARPRGPDGQVPAQPRRAQALRGRRRRGAADDDGVRPAAHLRRESAPGAQPRPAARPCPFSKEMEPFDRSIDTRITRIRRKIEPDPAKPDCLRTVRGAGYVYNPDCRTT